MLHTGEAARENPSETRSNAIFKPLSVGGIGAKSLINSETIVVISASALVIPSYKFRIT